jgi:hypothetical protein
MISSSIFEVEIGSRALHGSSKRITLGLTARVLAMQSLCCCPPLREKEFGNEVSRELAMVIN